MSAEGSERLGGVSGTGVSSANAIWGDRNRMARISPSTVKAGLGVVFGGFLVAQAYPTLYKWELLPFVKTEAYKRKAALVDYSGMDGIIYDAYDKGSEPPRSEMLPTSKGQIIL